MRKNQVEVVSVQQRRRFRKWYGNNDYVVNWEDDGDDIKRRQNSR